MKMPTSECSGSSSPFGHSILGIRRDHQVHSMDSTHDGVSNIESETDLFQKRVSDRILDLSSASSDDLLSLAWIRKLVDAFLCFHDEFMAIIQSNRARFAKPPMDRLVGDFFDRCVKALDVCNAVRDGIEQISQWQKLMEIVVCALSGQRSIGEGQFRRARKALVDLTIGMLDEKDSGTAISQRNRSFCRNRDQKSIAQFRSLSWSVSRSWSAARQLQAIAGNLTPPKAAEIVATNGFALSVFTMNCVLLFTMWSLVAAIPCQDRGLQIHFPIPRQFSWSAPMSSLHDRVMEESKKRDRRNTCGLLKEIILIEKCSKNLIEIGDSIQFPLPDEKEREVRNGVDDVSHVCEAIREGLDPLERQVREVFHKIVRSRTEGLDSFGSKTGTD